MTDDRQALRRAWARSDELFGLLHPADLGVSGIPLRHPFVFYLGHLPAFAWNHVAAVLGLPPMDSHLDVLFARGIDPDDEGAAAVHQRATWPAVDAVAAYRDRIRAALLDTVPALDAHPDPYARMLVPLIVEHELMHHETLLYMVARLPPERLAAPADWAPPVLAPAVAPTRQVAVEAGPVTLGAERAAVRFGWCNEFPAETVDVAAFDLDDRPVTVSDWLRFLEAGGYRNPKLWTEAAWAWRRQTGIEHPDAWRRTDHGWQVRSLFAWHDAAEVAGWPVYVSLAEARAWCRWVGRRLPTEAELHRAAFTPEGVVPEGIYGFTAHAPAPVDAAPAGPRGVRDLVGNGWEWTSTPFLPRAGFEAHLRTYPGYSSDFFDGRHFVVFGASWATDAQLVRRSFRNWYQRHYPYVWATFRTAA